MPVQVTKYTCEFRCGKKAASQLKTMTRHESTCWKNPENKTCKTCSNEVYEDGAGDFTSVDYFRGCRITEIDNVLESVSHILKDQNTVHARPIYNCPYWNKNADENVQSFAAELKQEIEGEDEGTKHYPFYNKPKKEESGSIF